MCREISLFILRATSLICSENSPFSLENITFILNVATEDLLARPVIHPNEEIGLFDKDCRLYPECDCACLRWSCDSVQHFLGTFRCPLDEINQNLKKYPWESEKDLVVLSVDHVKNIYKLFQKEKINDSDIEKWSNMIEGREDIGFENELLKDFIYEIANPAINGSISSLLEEWNKKNQ